MKWAKVKKDRTPPSADQIASYEYYANESTLNRQFAGNKDNLWVRYDLGKEYKPKDEVVYQRFQRDYEMYCGGFLQYYDIEVRNRATNHQLYFEWAPFKRDGTLYVALYLFPRPLKVKDRIEAWKKQQAANAGGLQKTAGEVLVEEAAADEREDLNASIDPPTPPPPPPPPRE